LRKWGDAQKLTYAEEGSGWTFWYLKVDHLAYIQVLKKQKKL